MTTNRTKSGSSAIERLKNIEGSWTVLGIPRTHYGKQLNNFDWTERPNAAKEIVRFIEEAKDRKAPHLLLMGGNGLGKTHIGVGLYRWAVTQAGTAASYFTDAFDFYDQVKATYNDPNLDNPFNSLALADFLVVIDDPFAYGTLRPGELNILIRMIDTAYSNGAALVVTMNDDFDGLKNYLPRHEVDRLTDRSIICHFTGKSWRGGR